MDQRSQFDESNAANRTHFIQINVTKEETMNVQEQFLPTGLSTTIKTLLNGTNCKIHNSGTTKVFMSN